MIILINCAVLQKSFHVLVRTSHFEWLKSIQTHFGMGEGLGNKFWWKDSWMSWLTTSMAGLQPDLSDDGPSDSEAVRTLAFPLFLSVCQLRTFCKPAFSLRWEEWLAIAAKPHILWHFQLANIKEGLWLAQLWSETCPCPTLQRCPHCPHCKCDPGGLPCVGVYSREENSIVSQTPALMFTIPDFCNLPFPPL